MLRPLLRSNPLSATCRHWLAAAAMAGMANGASAAIGLPAYYESAPAELVLTVWDPVAEASYSRDLGISMDAFLETAQTDAGMQEFWKIDAAADPAFGLFRAPGTDKRNLLWFISAIDSEGFGEAGDFRMVTTLRATTVAGQLGAAYDSLVHYNNLDFSSDVAIVAQDFYLQMNQDTLNTNNTHGNLGAGLASDNIAFNGSSYSVKGQVGYADSADQYWLLRSTRNINLTNPVGRSSWFYYVQNIISEEATDIAIVDEFDNLTNDGYWGLDEAADGSFVLSYSLFSTGPSAAQRAFAASIGRTELNGGFRTTALAGAALLGSDGRAYATGRPLPLAGVASPVPEPATVALMGLGVAAVIGAAARRRRPS
ncbi:PEP-CTERM sorting domain-containing protein [Aquincola sp. J276]|uniref:PEP-CTERM sorting domain-containing protein n=1 Tax=Aquincola sp. J276 TaxID=2898432 RepID=UPI0021507829|nr:PEP-CTERM sorting domain-containing protein [Aquincola sp. J276]MCR5867671.1 PEP-CTERM sorting domain-containing protein [Aquincola sp. J276]